MDTGWRCEAGWRGCPHGCADTAQGRYRRTCTHGHTYEGYLCAEHAKPPASAWCRSCHDEGHRCELDLTRISAAPGTPATVGAA
jgi:hypothetical protein